MSGSGWNAAALARDVRAGRSAPGWGAARAAARILALNPGLNALVDYDPAAAEPQVAALAARLAGGERPPLAGLPVAVKDHIFVEGWPATEGSLLLRDRIAGQDEPIVARLRRAGAIVVGRTNMSEFGCKGVTTNRLYGPTRHPLDPALTPGGSSGGAASAVAAGLVPLALAGDGGGSVRRPAAHVGVVGWKPSTGALPDPRSPSHTSVFGLLAGDVATAAAAFEALLGADPRDPVSVPMPRAAPAAIATLRIAFSPRLGLLVPVDDDVAEAIEAAVERLAGAGLAIARADPLWPDGASEEALMPIQHAGLAAEWGERWRGAPDLFDPDIGEQIERGLALSGTEIVRAEAMSLAVARAAAAFFADGVDLLLAPTAPCVAWPLDRLGPSTIGGVSVGPRAHAVFTPFFNHAFCPAISLPAGRGRDGLPVGLQVVGPRFADRTVLRAAAGIEAILSGEARTRRRTA